MAVGIVAGVFLFLSSLFGVFWLMVEELGAISVLKLVLVVGEAVGALFALVGGILCAVAANEMNSLPSVVIAGRNVLCLAGLCNGGQLGAAAAFLFFSLLLALVCILLTLRNESVSTGGSHYTVAD